MSNTTAQDLNMDNALSHFIFLISGTLDKLLSPTLNKIGNHFYPIFEPFYQGVDNISASLNFDRSMVLVMFVLFSAYPLAIVHRFVKGRFLRNLYSAFWGLFFCFLVYQWLALHALAMALVPYFLLYVLPARYVAYFTYVYVFAYMSLCHIYRMATDFLGYKLDFSCVMMVVVFKTISCIYSVYDGTKKPEEMNGAHVRTSLKEIPSLLEYLGYMFFYPPVMSGPVYEMKDYQDLSTWRRKPPLALGLVLSKLLGGFFCMAAFLVIAPVATRDILLDPFNSSLTWWQRILYAHLILIRVRMTLFTGWHIAEGACILAGLGYSEKEVAGKEWAYIDQADIIGFEFSTSLKDIMTQWNKSVSRWLHLYVNTRVTPDPKKYPHKKSRLTGLIATFTISAIWHGFYPGYFMMWVPLAVANQISQMLRDKMRPRLLNEANVKRDQNVNAYRFAGYILTHLCMDYFGVTFVLLTWEDSVKYFNRVYWIGHILLLIVFIVVTLLPYPPKPKDHSSNPQDDKKSTKEAKEKNA